MNYDTKYRIAMISDFFYPNIGGVENHIYELSQCLIKLGHSVIVVTHSHRNTNGFCRQGVRYLKNKLKVYYLPLFTFYNQCTFPTLYGSLSIIRHVLVREAVQIVHCHSAFSALALESLLHAKTLGLHTVFTDHSLFGFADLSSIIMNKLLQWSLKDADAVICVSHTAKENTVIRAYLDWSHVYVIPNAVHASLFTPDSRSTSRGSNSPITVVVVSRLIYRKGLDLLIAIIPDLCRLYPQLRFIIGGDGPKRLDLEEMRERYSLFSQVDLRGALPHSAVRETLLEGDIFINPSLTEAFCIAIVEAASCGLKVVATNVGGVCEVLPAGLIHLCEPTIKSLREKMTEVVDLVVEERRLGVVSDAWSQHVQVASFYCWEEVARRTETVYSAVLAKTPLDSVARLKIHGNISAIGGKIFMLMLLAELLLYRLLCVLWPTEDMVHLSRDDDEDVTLARSRDWHTVRQQQQQ